MFFCDNPQMMLVVVPILTLFLTSFPKNFQNGLHFQICYAKELYRISVDFVPSENFQFTQT